MKAILIDRHITTAEIFNINDKYRGGDIEILTLVDFKNQFNWDVNVLKLSKSEIDDINDQVYHDLDKYYELLLLKAPKLISDGFISIWYYQRFRLFFERRNFLNKYSLISGHLKKYSEISFYTNDLKFKKHFPEKIKFYSPLGNKKNKSLIIRQFFFLAIKYIISIFHIPFCLLLDRAKNLLIYPTTNKDFILDLKGEGLIHEVNHLFYLFDQNQDEIILIQDNFIPSAKSSFRRAIKKLGKIPSRKRVNIEGIYLLTLISNPRIMSRAYKSYTTLKKELYTLIEKIRQNESPMSYFMTDALIKNFSSNLVFIFRFYIFKRFFKGREFNSILTIDENGALKKSILDAAKFNSIKTIGIQHGAIHELLPTYFYNRERDPLYIIPDLTVLWGKSYQNLLINKSIYNSNNTLVVGQIRTDIIPNLMGVKNKNKDRIIITFVTQPLPNANLRRRVLQDMYRACSQNENIRLIIRPHPSEETDYFYRALKDTEGIPNSFRFKMERSKDLYSILGESDYIFTCYSTVGLEAMYFNKPLVILDYYKQDLVGYIKNGKAHPIYDNVELEECISEISVGNLKFDTSQYQKMINTYVHKIDGKVCERILGATKTRGDLYGTAKKP